MSAERFAAKVEAWGGTVRVSNFKGRAQDGCTTPSTVCLSASNGPTSFCWHIKAEEARDLARVLNKAAEALDAADAQEAPQ